MPTALRPAASSRRTGSAWLLPLLVVMSAGSPLARAQQGATEQPQPRAAREAASRAVAPRAPGPRRDISAELSAAQARIDEQDWLGAVDVLKKARAKDPGNINVLNLLGHVQRRAGDLDGAIASFQTLLRQQPAHRSAREQLGKALLLMGRPDEAQQQLEELHRQCGDCAEARELDNVIRGNLQR